MASSRVMDADNTIPVLPSGVKLKLHWNISNGQIFCIITVPSLRLVSKYKMQQFNSWNGRSMSLEC